MIHHDEPATVPAIDLQRCPGTRQDYLATAQALGYDFGPLIDTPQRSAPAAH